MLISDRIRMIDAPAAAAMRWSAAGPDCANSIVKRPARPRLGYLGHQCSHAPGRPNARMRPFDAQTAKPCQLRERYHSRSRRCRLVLWGTVECVDEISSRLLLAQRLLGQRQHGRNRLLEYRELRFCGSLPRTIHN